MWLINNNYLKPKYKKGELTNIEKRLFTSAVQKKTTNEKPPASSQKKTTYKKAQWKKKKKGEKNKAGKK